jgi:hypothetical protein
MDEELQIPSPNRHEDHLMNVPDHLKMPNLCSLAVACFQNQHVLAHLYWQTCPDSKISAITAASVHLQQQQAKENSSEDKSLIDAIDVIPSDLVKNFTRSCEIKPLAEYGERFKALEKIEVEGKHYSTVQKRRMECLKLLLNEVGGNLKRAKNYFEKMQKNGVETAKSDHEMKKLSPIVRWTVLSLFPIIEAVSIASPDSKLKQNCINILVNILKNSDPLSLEYEGDEEINQLVTMLKSADEKECQITNPTALCAFLGIALQKGKLSLILESLNSILHSKVQVDIACYIEQLKLYGNRRSISLAPQSSQDISCWSHHPFMEANLEFSTLEANNYASCASSGKFIYVHRMSGILCIGTGRFGSLLGSVYKFKCYRPNEPGSLVYFNGKLIFRTRKMSSDVFGYLISPDTLEEIGTIKHDLENRNSGDYFHFLCNQSFLYLIRSLDQDSNRFYLDKYSIKDEIAILESSIRLPPGWTQFPLPSNNRNASFQYSIGQKLDAKDSVNKWCSASVIKVTSSRVLIHYEGWSSK